MLIKKISNFFGAISTLFWICLAVLGIIVAIGLVVRLAIKPDEASAGNILLLVVMGLVGLIILILLIIAVVKIHEKLEDWNIELKMPLDMRRISKEEMSLLEEKRKKWLQIVKENDVLLIITKQEFGIWVSNAFYIVCAIVLFLFITWLNGHC